METEPRPEPPQGSLFRGVRAWLASWADLLRVRAEIFGLDLEEQVEWILKRLMFALAALLAVGAGLFLLTFFIIMLFPDTQRVVALGVFALLYFAGGGALVYRLKKTESLRPKPFATTLAELGKDRAMVQPPKP
jgi:uncharacterized membrane protein YqjE